MSLKHAEEGAIGDPGIDGPTPVIDCPGAFAGDDMPIYVVGVGDGTGVLLRLHRDVPRTPLRQGTVAIATVSSIICGTRAAGRVGEHMPLC